MTRKYFGTDGIRGKVGVIPITPSFVMRLGFAAGEVLVARERRRKNEHPAVLIGKDTRISGYMLEAALEAGFSAAGVDVMLTGPLPTPAIAYLTRALRLQAGIVISASHNPYSDNGIKFFSADGNKLPDAIEREIEAALEQPMVCRESAELGKARRIDDAAGRYIEFCKSTFPNRLDLRGMKIVVDCAHGASYHVAPPVFHELGADVVAIGVEPNGLNINAAIGAVHPEALRLAVKKHRADLGIALDGDGDRLVMVDSAGRLYDGDELLYVIAKHRRRIGKLIGGVVGTMMSNLGFEQALKKQKIQFARAAVGDRYVLEMMLDKGWQLGGENSGHIICLEQHTTGDAIIAALQVLAALRETQVTLKQSIDAMTLYPQTLINVPVNNKNAWQENSSIRRAINATEKKLNDSGRVLLRASGTEPVIRVMVEARDAAVGKRLARTLAEQVQQALV